MTRLQAWISSLLVLAVAVTLALVGAVTHNDTLLGVGLGLVPAAAAALGIPRPQDASD
jgi:hypothetical protein